MSDTNQIIKTLHERADAALSKDIVALQDSIEKFVATRGVWIGVSVKCGDKDYQLSSMIRWLTWELIKVAVQDKCRESEVKAFMERVANLSSEIDEIRSIAEQGAQQ